MKIKQKAESLRTSLLETQNHEPSRTIVLSPQNTETKKAPVIVPSLALEALTKPVMPDNSRKSTKPSEKKEAKKAFKDYNNAVLTNNNGRAFSPKEDQ